MIMKKDQAWNVNVDGPVHNNIQDSAKAAYLNGTALIEETRILFEATRYARASALAILAQEELGKAFILLMCAQDQRWDSAI